MSSSSPLASATGFNSGLPINDIITQLLNAERIPINQMKQRQEAMRKQMNTYSVVQGKVNDLLTAVKKLTERSVTKTNAFDAMIGTSSEEKIATATAGATAANQTIDLEVKNLPSQTKARSTGLVGKFDNTTLLSDLGVTDGAFSMYVNGTAYTINVLGTQTMGDVFSAINTAIPDTEISADPTIVDGKVSMAYNGGNATTISFGAGSDTSNFLAKLHLNTAINNGTDTITASQGRSTIAVSEQLSNAAANLNIPVTDGTFSINGISFDTTGKSLGDIITEINASAAKVTASFNMNSNKFELTAKDAGSAMISLADTGSNFLTAMGLIVGGDTTASQTAGKNAEFVLNGVTMYSTSTLVDETVSGLTGVTLNLKKAETGTTVQITVQKDKDTLKAAIKDVIEKYNEAITYIDQQTNAKDKAILASENRLKTLRGSLRSLFTSQVAGGSSTYDSLQQVGITTGAIGTGAAGASPKLQLDEAKLEAALAADPEAIKKLFIGQDLTGDLDGTAGDNNMEGTLTKVFHLLADQVYTDGTGGYGALYAGTSDSNKGLFFAYQASVQKRIEALDKSIKSAEDRMAMKEKRLRQQYLSMERMIGQYQSQGTAVNGLIASLSAGK